MTDDEKLMRLLLASLNYQAVFGLFILAAIFVASLVLDRSNPMMLTIVAAACVFASHVIAGRGMDRALRGDFRNLKFGFNVSRILWYAATVFTVAAAALIA